VPENRLMYMGSGGRIGWDVLATTRWNWLLTLRYSLLHSKRSQVVPFECDTANAMRTDCACGSGKTYDECCGRFHAGVAVAQTALELMRSRYTAFTLDGAHYLLETWHPMTRPDALELDPAIEWRRLQIRGHSRGTENDKDGTVEFVAHYWDSGRGEYGRQHENSKFVREDGRWLYVEPAS
jgi:SEC-C motif domain protein